MLSQLIFYFFFILYFFNNFNDCFGSPHRSEQAAALPYALQLFFPSRSYCTNGRICIRTGEILPPLQSPYGHGTGRCFDLGIHPPLPPDNRCRHTYLTRPSLSALSPAPSKACGPARISWLRGPDKSSAHRTSRRRPAPQKEPHRHSL